MSKNSIIGSVRLTPVANVRLLWRLALICVAASLAFSDMAIAGPKYAGIVVDAKTGKVLYSEDADTLRYPASLTKMMTLYLTFEAMEAGKINRNTPVPFSQHAASEAPSKLGVRAGQSITVEQAILSLVTRSANDSATALGELLGGSTDRFGRIMTNKARALGMTRTTYRNANGLPEPTQMTTARDQARLGMALRQHFPQYYAYFSTRSFRFGRQTIGNHNRLLGAVRGVDGIKTGYTRAAGFNLVTSAQADGRSIVGVVLGGTSGGARDAQMRALVAKYLPAASKRGNGNLIADAADAPTLGVTEQPATETQVAEQATTVRAVTGGSFNLPDSGPVPGVRYDGEQSEDVEVAYAAPAKAGKNPVLATEEAVQPNTLQAQSRKLAKAAPVPAADLDAQITNSVEKPAKADDTQSGWVIQIGATPDKAQAMTLLNTAKTKGGKVLSGAKPFTVAFSSGGSQLYRARFGGFANQTKAQSACKTLKKAGFSCWASLQ